MWRRWMVGVITLEAAIGLLGCQGAGAKAEDERIAPSGASGDAGGDVGILSPGAGALSPVTGSQELAGGGGGVQQAVKEKAKSIANDPPSSLGSVPGHGDD